jgi:HSP20 family protein
MTNVKFNSRPFEGTLNSLVDSLFNELPVIFKNEINNSQGKGFIPVNVKETEKAFVLEVVAPGFEKTDFKLSLDQNLLTIEAEKKEETVADNVKQLRKEYSFRSFKRSFTIDDKVDATKIEASYINGVLILNLPKKVEVKVQATEIKIN